jgi:N-acetylglutamate synthase-like GNAT family acetyltransferase
MTVPSIRTAQTKDVHHLVDIDLKSYDYPWTVDEWRKLSEDPTCIIVIASFKVEPISVCVWRKKPAVKEAEILRLATKPKYRKRGAATFLLNAAEHSAKAHELEKVTIIVPEINCFPGHFDDVSQWLLKRGYQAIAPILKNHFYMYGKRCDGFKFEKVIGESNA